MALSHRCARRQEEWHAGLAHALGPPVAQALQSSSSSNGGTGTGDGPSSGSGAAEQKQPPLPPLEQSPLQQQQEGMVHAGDRSQPSASNSRSQEGSASVSEQR